MKCDWVSSEANRMTPLSAVALMASEKVPDLSNESWDSYSSLELECTPNRCPSWVRSDPRGILGRAQEPSGRG